MYKPVKAAPPKGSIWPLYPYPYPGAIMTVEKSGMAGVGVRQTVSRYAGQLCLMSIGSVSVFVTWKASPKQAKTCECCDASGRHIGLRWTSLNAAPAGHAQDCHPCVDVAGLVVTVVHCVCSLMPMA